MIFPVRNIVNPKFPVQFPPILQSRIFLGFFSFLVRNSILFLVSHEKFKTEKNATCSRKGHDMLQCLWYILYLQLIIPFQVTLVLLQCVPTVHKQMTIWIKQIISILYSALINMYYSAYSTKICVVCPAAGFFHHYNLLLHSRPPLPAALSKTFLQSRTRSRFLCPILYMNDFLTLEQQKF